ncbi:MULTISPECIES: hypothetical protein [unclassified Beijerinckia]|uniref:hypothetical protein n=1 Tax=unclassified Beijerinckia TaxID=2638183 RepID=UPI000896AC1E|nr:MULTISPECIES: hypothetical protein [unclassified Beijerinckia]MDH7794405.1 hypothetical protein [Beijerinckia sp. GAS462]SEB61254.1 hypothetical protein SAMN05443249_0676 [Beijerinckia sp. 28-YEA-48]
MGGKRILAKLVFVGVCLAWLPEVFENGLAAAPLHKVVTCPYLKAPDLQFDVPAKLGDVPNIEFDYPAKVTRFSLRDGSLLLVAMDEGEPSRVRIVVSAQLNKAKSTYDGQIMVDMGGNQLQLYNGPVRCKVDASAR